MRGAKLGKGKERVEGRGREGREREGGEGEGRNERS